MIDTFTAKVEFTGANTGAHKVKLFGAAPGAGADEIIPAENLHHDKKHDPTGK